MNEFINPEIRRSMLMDELRPKITDVRNEYESKIQKAQSKQEKRELKLELKRRIQLMTKDFMEEFGEFDPYCLY